MAKKKDIIISEGEKEIIIPKYKQKTLQDQFMILLGILLACFIFLVIFDLFYECSLFGWLFNHDEWLAYRKIMEGGEGIPVIYDHDDLLFKGFWLPTLIYTAIFLISAILVISLVLQYIRDYIEVVIGTIKIMVEVKKGAEENLKEALAPKAVVAKKKNITQGVDSKYLQELQLDEEVESETAVKESKKRGPKPKKKEVPVVEEVIMTDAEEQELDRLLNAEEIEPEETDYIPKSLFSEKD